MRKLASIWLWTFGFLTLSLPVQAGGGPDLFGYRWLDSNDTAAAAPSYSWVDIRGLPGSFQLPLQRDDAVSPWIAIGFDFTFYWTGYNQLKVGTNGFIGFGNIQNISLCLDPIPTPGGQGDNFIAPMLSDLNFAENFSGFPNAGEIWYWSNQTDSFIVSWIDAPFWRDPNTFGPPDFWGNNTFQMILSARDSSITFQYAQINPALRASDPACTINSEIGIENLTGNVGLVAWSDTLPADTMNYAIKFVYPDTPGFVIPDPTPRWNANPDNKGQFFFQGDLVDMTTNIANVGNQNLITPVQVFGKLTTLNPTDIRWQDTVILAGIPLGTDSIVHFPDSAPVATADQYYYTVRISNPDDVNLSNNQNVVELSVVEGNRPVIPLTYCTTFAPDGAIGWGVGPDYGVGIYIEPPIYPADIIGMDVFVVSFDPQDTTVGVGSGFRLNIYAEDSAGNPGALLFSKAVPQSAVIADDWNYIFFDSITTINSSGFYAAWLHDGDSISLGTEEFGPISRRSFEILAGQWAPYRDGNREDLLMVVNLKGPDAILPAQTPVLPMEIFPNPSSRSFRIRVNMEKGGPLDLRLFDLNGKVVWRGEHPWVPVGEHTWSADISAIPEGFYVLKATSRDRSGIGKVVIVR